MKVTAKMMGDSMISTPLVEPRGNGLLLSPEQMKTVIDTKFGLGPILNAIGGVEKLNDKLFPYLGAADLCRLSCCSRALWTLVIADDGLWRDVAQCTLSDDDLDTNLKRFSNWKSVATGIRCEKRRFGRLFSDALHRPIQCARSRIDPYWLVRDNVVRVDKISSEDFIEKYESTRTPVVISGFAKDFAHGCNRWRNGLKEGMQTLQNQGGKFRCGARSINCQSFAAYSRSDLAMNDESPLYIFDARFGENFPELAEDYRIPDILVGPDRDLFSYLGAKRRPDYRWVIAGAGKSGSKWHIDPNNTHAWNVSLKGKKKWVMLPPWGQPPPGVFPSPDGGSVAQPVSLMEWFLEFYKTTRKTRENQLIEFIADVGEFVFVPNGWWHAVLNIEESFAVTQNYVSRSNLLRAIRFFEQKPDQISGLTRSKEDADDRRKTFAEEFRAALRDKCPEVYRDIIEEDVAKKVTQEPQTTLSLPWSTLVPKKDNSCPDGCDSNPFVPTTAQVSTPSTFSFGFQLVDEDLHS